MSQKYTVEVKRLWIVLGVTYLKTNLAKLAWSHKIVERVEAFLRDHPGDRYRLTAECIDDEEREDRESEEEQADASGTHYR